MIRELRTPQQLRAAFPVLHELRPHLTFASFVKIYKVANKADQYTVVGMFIDDECAAVMGYRVLTDLVHGRYLYIDDLVTTQARRGQGLGAKLLQFAEEKARELRCAKLRLCTGAENAAGKRFYEREGWELRSVAYKKNVSAKAA